MNERLYAVCAELSISERTSHKGLFFKSIHGTLNHLLWADLLWLSRFTGDGSSAPPIGTDLFDDFEKLALARSDCDAKISDWANALDDEWLAGPVTFTSKTYNTSCTRPGWLLVSHMFNHATHHRGQLTAVLSQMGCDYGITDLPFMPEENLPDG